MKLYLKTLILLCLSQQISAQINGYFKNLGPDDGLPTDRVLCTAQDKNGFMWIGTNDGLVRFDGYRMTILRHIEGDSTTISGNIITQLLLDSKGLLWIGTYESGLCLLDPQTQKTVLHFSEKSKRFPIKDNKIQALWEDTRNQKLWIGTNLKLADCFDLKTRKILTTNFLNKNTSNFKSKRDKTAWSFGEFKGNKNKVWLATNDGLLLYEYNTDSYEWFKYGANEKPENETKNRIRNIVVEDSNQVWMACRGGGIVRFDYDSKIWKSYQYIPENIKSDSKNLVVFLLPNRRAKDEFWVATLDNSLGIFNKKTGIFRFFKNDPINRYSILSNEINRIFYDKTNTLWSATNKGISLYTEKFQRFLFKNIPQNTSIENKFFGPMSYSENGNQLFFGMTNGSGLYTMNKSKNTFEVVKPKGSKPTDFYSFVRMSKDRENNIWLVSLSGLFKYDINTKELSKVNLPNPYSLDSLKSQSLGFDKNGLLYVGTRRRGMLRINTKTLEIKQFSVQKNSNSIASNGYIQEILCDRSGILWIATERGLSRFDPKTEIFANFFEGDNTAPKGVKTIYRLVEDKKGLIWLTTESEGAYAIDPTTLKFVKNINQKDGLASNAVNGLACDVFNRIWLATTKGLCCYDQNTKEVYIFDKKNGLYQENLDLGIATLQNQQIILGYKNGYTIFSPANFTPNRSLLVPKVTNFYVFEKPHEFHKNQEINLLYNQNFFGFEFSALDFLSPEKIQYSYQLAGIDKDWIDIKGAEKANYTNLAAGNYTLKVRATEQNSQWPAKFTSLAVNISPPFWLTWWFILLCLTSATLAGLVVYNKKIETINKEAKIKEQIINLQMTVLRSQMNPHFMFNSLNTVRYFVLSDQKEKAKNYLAKFSKLLRTILSYSRENTISLSNELEAIGLYLEIELGRFESNFFYSIKIDDEIDLDFIMIPPLMLQPFVENAIIHGLRNSEKAEKTLHIEVAQPNETALEISIIDNGIGRAKANQMHHQRDNLYKSFGTAITNQRIELFNQSYPNKIKVETHDLENESGTRVFITIQL